MTEWEPCFGGVEKSHNTKMDRTLGVAIVKGDVFIEIKRTSALEGESDSIMDSRLGSEDLDELIVMLIEAKMRAEAR